MPPKGKAAAGKAAGKTKASETSSTGAPPPPTPPQQQKQASASTTGAAAAPNPTEETVLDRFQTRFALARPYEQAPPPPPAPQDQTTWLATRIASRLARRPALSSSSSTSSSTSPSGGTATSGGGSSSSGSNGGAAAALARVACGGGAKTLKEVWKTVNEGGIALRVARRPAVRARGGGGRGSFGAAQGQQQQQQGPGSAGAAGITVREFEARWERKLWLSCLAVESWAFRERRARQQRGEVERTTGEGVVVTEQEVFAEGRRRREMAALKRELYGGGVGVEGKLAGDPEWDDVVPVVLEEPEGALAAIAYPAEYAEAMAYLRAVMQAKEYSPRCLRLTEHIIAMNPAHYTVWLYRASIVFALQLPIPDEIAWLNGVALANLKNYQIWHHRHLLVENYFPTIAGDPDAIAAFAASERDFLRQILAEDTKNYHVWSYRSYLVGKLGLFGSAEELQAIEAMIDDDVRNNSAWSHRFFLVFSNPAHATPGVAATEPDPKVPQAVVDREVAYAEDKIRLAPQNQSGWNYLRGVLVKGGRKLATVEEFASEFVTGLGQGDGGEDVLSTHALDLLAEIYAEKGDKEMADLSLRRLGQKWDRIRVGYWEWRRKCLETPA